MTNTATVPKTKYSIVSFPAPEILLVRLNWPKDLDCINTEGDAGLQRIWEHLGASSTLRVGIIMGTEWDGVNSKNVARPMLPTGFAGLSRRSGLKPIIAAVNGICFGVASQQAIFALPEVRRGIVAIAGALPRVVRTIGRPRAMEMALTGRPVPAEEAEQWGLINAVVPGGEAEMVAKAVEYAKMIVENSPDAVIISREVVKLGWEGVGAEHGARFLIDQWYPKLLRGENIKQGVRAFVEKRKPVWQPAKL
ncbi:enoyl-CoA hydratase [Myriangium duriaei CBS 260.36]|uniref:Enoyl-CoA hydratase n=1 Tax=Myriangium duriaei CBS 260.36 TaxID=1168546 RepID=A0A9P4MRM9_9PEZI|nr:enoyl-CoA hydratase [Myriangium duriaei CBS 260.36]